jgi:16S rRNA (uracil1498-N3)-methyltransferase
VIRLYVEADLSAAATIGLAADQAHYLQHVMRAKKGDAVALFNGRDGEWLAAIEGFGKGWASLTVSEQRRPQRVEPDLWLVFAPIKGARIDFVAEKATELGISALWPVFTRRTVVTRVNEERLFANAVQAAEQCERLSAPMVRPAVTLDKALAGWPTERRLLVLDETGTGTPIAAALAALPAGPAAVLTGPEGGFTNSELDDLRRLPFVTFIGLGPRILRADTAALAALACWQAWCGDWGERPAFRSGESSP